MPLNFTTTDQASANHGVKVLVYSESGIGKTTLCATAPAPIIISAESGLLSLKNFKIPVIQIKSLQDLNDAYNWIAAGKQGADQFQTVCVDSITEIAEVILAAAKKSVKDPRQAYGELIDKTLEAVKNFRDLPRKNVYMAAKMERAKDELSGMMLYGPSMPGAKLGPALPYYFDEVFNLRVMQTTDGQKYRALVTQPDMQYVAKDRSGALDAIEPPNLAQVFAKIQGGSQ
jgi:hypothetical protein